MFDVDSDAWTVEGPPPAVAGATADHDAVTLVAAVVTNETPVARRVRLATTLDAPVLPPRRHGVPEAGWSEDGFAGVVPAAGRLALGFAVGGAHGEPPAEVLDRGRADDDAGEAPTPADLLRDLGSPAPPREAVPAGPVAVDAEEPGDAADPVPAHVRAWLETVEDRLDRGATEPGDRAALRRVAERAAALASECGPAAPAEAER